jgi:hypothetical protein
MKHPQHTTKFSIGVSKEKRSGEMYNYTRKYYIHNTEVRLATLLKYIEIMLTHHNIQPNKLPVSFVDEKIQTKGE